MPELTPGTRFPVSTVIRDSLYDLIPLAEPELELMSTAAFLRLERIQQLGFVSRIWPTARHTRYEHSLGVFHLARLAVDQIRRSNSPVTFTDEDARTLAAAALLHDVGHYPFSHAIEELGPPVLSHEVVGSELIRKGEVSRILDQRWGVDPQRVAHLVVPPSGPAEHPKDMILRMLISGPLDVDKLDYLPRDARGCNVPYGGVDTARLISALRVADVPGEGVRLVVDAKGISPLHSLINARQEMFDNVYWHHTNRAGMAMLLRSVQEAILAGQLPADQLRGADDASLLAMLREEQMPEVTRQLASSLHERQFHKRAVEISSRSPEIYDRLGSYFQSPAGRRELEQHMTRRLAEVSGVDWPDGTVLIDIPKPEKWRTDVWIEFTRPPVGFDRFMPWLDVVGMDAGDFKRYEDHRRLIRIVASEPAVYAVRAHWQTLLDGGQ